MKNVLVFDKFSLKKKKFEKKKIDILSNFFNFFSKIRFFKIF